MRCERYIKRGNFMTFGPVQWVQCKNDAAVMLTVIQDRKKSKLPSCNDCWKKAIKHKIKIVKVEPIE